MQQKTLIGPRISDIDRTAEAAFAFVIGRAKRLWRKFSKREKGCHDQDIMKHESDMQQKWFFLYVMGGAAREL